MPPRRKVSVRSLTSSSRPNDNSGGMYAGLPKTFPAQVRSGDASQSFSSETNSLSPRFLPSPQSTTYADS